jgi:D-sedoheptulose 7-phosphate isomerase
MSIALSTVRQSLARQMAARNACSAAFFAAEATRLASICRAMAGRFRRGGRLLAFGAGAASSDAQHIAVEFVHPVLVGKRALPAMDLSATHSQSLHVIARADDIVVAFGPPGGDRLIDASLEVARARGALTLAFPGTGSDYAAPAPSTDPFIHQELVEVAYHTLWETVHVFLERAAVPSDAGHASFLYPFLGEEAPDDDIVAEVAASICSKAACVERLREQIARDQADAIAAAVAAIGARVARGATILCFGNGGSATDAADFAYDLTASPKGYAAVPAISLAAEAATLSAIANDVGVEALFLRQVIAHGRPGDVVLAISTSGGSSNVIAALGQARANGLLTVALLGYDGGEILRRRLADHVVVVASDQIPRIQETQASVYHVMIDLLAAQGLTGE